VIGWYVHDHGRGHLQRLQCIAGQLRTPVTALSSAPVPTGFDGGWVPLPDDLPAGADHDVAAGGTLHWAPRHHDGLRERMALIAAWVASARPALVVVDVSVEVAVLVRSMGVPVVVAAMRGDRNDRAHRTAYDLAEALLAPWPATSPEPWPQHLLAKTWHVGALSRADGRTVAPAPGNRRVAVLWGSGGSTVGVADVDAAAAATPGWTWEAVGLPGSPWTHDPWSLLQRADVVVTHAGQNALAEVAAARRPALVLPQPRPFDEQVGTGRALSRAGLAEVRSTWPDPGQWPVLLEQLTRRDGARWQQWSDGLGAVRAAALRDGLAQQIGSGRPLGTHR